MADHPSPGGGCDRRAGGVGVSPPTAHPTLGGSARCARFDGAEAHTAYACNARFPAGPMDPVAAYPRTTNSGRYATLSKVTVRELLAELQHLPRDLEVLAFEAG